MIRAVNPAADAGAICEIYNHYVTATTVTFEMEPVTAQTMQARIEEITGRFPYLVYEIEEGGDKRIVGYSYAGVWRARAAFHRTVETSVYLHKDYTGKSIGKSLYEELIQLLRTDYHMHVLVAGITLPNAASEALHEKLGFCKVAHFNEVGDKFGRWIDLGFWQLKL